MKQPNVFAPIGLVFLALFLTTSQLVFSNTTQSLDGQLALVIYNTNAGPAIASLMVLSSRFGREAFWTLVTGLMLLLGKRNTKQLALQLTVLFVAGILTGDLIKLVSYRPRPYNTVPGIAARIPMDSDSSFPSGHVLIVATGAVFALTKFKGKKPKLTSFLLTVEAAIVSYSRIYLGVHYPLDILGGVFLAGAIVFLGVFVFERFLRRFFQFSTLVVEQILVSLRVPEIL